MTNLIKTILPLFVLLLLSACNIEGVPVKEDKTAGTTKCEITQDEALSRLECFIGSIGSNTKAITRKDIRQITPISLAGRITKSTLDSLDCSNLVYLVNFDNNRGYAIIAADNRIDYDVLAFTDSCSLSAMELEQTLDRVLEYSQPLPENQEQTDTTVAFEQVNIDIPIGDILPPEGVPEYKATEEMMNSLALSYALNGIARGNIHQVETEIGDMVVIGDTGSNGFEIENPRAVTVVEISRESHYLRTVEPLLEEMKMWSQSAPFNDFYPMKNSTEHYFAGCYPLSVSKILALFEIPNNFTYNGCTVNWYLLKKYCDPVSAATLLYNVSNGCDVMYFQQGTFAWPSSVRNYMSTLFPNVDLSEYDSSKVYSSIMRGCPVIISAVPRENALIVDLFNGHAWTLDGIITYRTTITNDYYQHGDFIRRGSYNEDKYYYHCNFGWNNSYSGYYPDRIFDNTNEKVIFDNNAQKIVEEHKFYRFLNIITYDKPSYIH